MNTQACTFRAVILIMFGIFNIIKVSYLFYILGLQPQFFLRIRLRHAPVQEESLAKKN